MQTDVKLPPRAPGKWLTVLIAVSIVAGFIVVSRLAQSVVSELEAISSATIDNVSWNTSQLEVELLRAHEATVHALDDRNGTLSDVRMRFDIFYSRVATMRESDLFTTLRQDPAAGALLASTTEFLNRTTPLIDAPDSVLWAGLSDLETQLDDLQTNVRQIALTGTQLYVAQDTLRRYEISRTLLELALALFLLILALIVALAVLMKLVRRGQLYVRDIHAARSRFEAAISSSLDAVVVVNAAGRIIDFNGAGEAVFGYTYDEVIGADMAELIIPEHLREDHRRGMSRFLKTTKNRIIGNGRVRMEGLRKSGEVFPVEMSISVAEAEGERVFVSFLRDITQELEAEDQLRRARDKAEQSEKAKSDLLTVMSHEMRTPLNGILGSLSLIDRNDMSLRNTLHLQSIQVSGELLLSHVNDVLDLSSLNPENLRRRKGYFDLRELIGKVVTSLQANAQARGNQFAANFLTDGLGVVLGYEIALQQCLVNLAGNAIKFTRDGEVLIEVERLPDAGLVEIRVMDTGVGIAPADLDRIFDPFVTVDTAFSRENAGTGLGLAITKRLADAMGATIRAESEKGEGSLFTLHVPLPEAERPRETKTATPHQAPLEIPPGQTALVVDDNEINRMILMDMLSDLGIEADQAADGFAAIEALKDRHFDIILLDISMPGIDGLETLERIRDLKVDWCNLPAIAVTAHAATQDHDRIMNADFNCLLVKPVNPSSIREAIACALGLDEPAPDTEKPDSRSDFEQRFGKERYDCALREVQADLSDLLQELEAAPRLTGHHRHTAHKLAGSAAVLCQQKMLEKLQKLHQLPTDTPLEDHAKLIAGLRAALEGLTSNLCSRDPQA